MPLGRGQRGPRVSAPLCLPWSQHTDRRLPCTWHSAQNPIGRVHSTSMGNWELWYLQQRQSDTEKIMASFQLPWHTKKYNYFMGAPVCSAQRTCFLLLSLNKCLSDKTDGKVSLFLSYFLFKFYDLIKKKKVKRDFLRWHLWNLYRNLPIVLLKQLSLILVLPKYDLTNYSQLFQPKIEENVNNFQIENPASF